MKKNSKAVERHPAETIGVDLGDKMSKYAILNEEGVVVEEGSFCNNMESIGKHFGKRGKARVALEVGTQSAWIAREFGNLGHEVIVANARELKWITSSDTKNDRNDTRAVGDSILNLSPGATALRTAGNTPTSRSARTSRAIGKRLRNRRERASR